MSWKPNPFASIAAALAAIIVAIFGWIIRDSFARPQLINSARIRQALIS